MKPKSIILLSGGLDSTVSATIAKDKTRPLFSITFDYGQRSAKQEIKASRKISHFLGIKHKVIKLDFFKEFKNLALLRYQPQKGFNRFNELEGVWVPNRNGLFINIAACYAEYYRAQLIITGFNREEAREFPDNRLQFVDLINKTLSLSTLKGVKVKSYVARYSKFEIYKIGLKLNAPIRYIYSCYLGEKEMCGNCTSCKRLKMVEKKLGLKREEFR